MALRKVAFERRDDGTWPEPDGEIVEVLTVGTETIRLLVREKRILDDVALFDPTEYSVSGLRDELGDYDPTTEEREAMLALEREGSNRKTAIQAIEDA